MRHYLIVISAFSCLLCADCYLLYLYITLIRAQLLYVYDILTFIFLLLLFILSLQLEMSVFRNLNGRFPRDTAYPCQWLNCPPVIQEVELFGVSLNHLPYGLKVLATLSMLLFGVAFSQCYTLLGWQHGLVLFVLFIG